MRRTALQSCHIISERLKGREGGTKREISSLVSDTALVTTYEPFIGSEQNLSLFRYFNRFLDLEKDRTTFFSFISYPLLNAYVASECNPSSPRGRVREREREREREIVSLSVKTWSGAFFRAFYHLLRKPRSVFIYRPFDSDEVTDGRRKDNWFWQWLNGPSRPKTPPTKYSWKRNDFLFSSCIGSGPRKFGKGASRLRILLLAPYTFKGDKYDTSF